VDQQLVSEFVAAVPLETGRVRNPPPFILLCGARPGRDPTEPSSAREAFHGYLRQNRSNLAGQVILAEDVNDGSAQAGFRDLLEFQEYLAHLVALILVFVDSAGSIAELSTFASLSLLSEKTLAVIEQSLAGPERSFIRDGPLARLSKETAGGVHCYDWLTTSGPQRIDPHRLLPACADLASSVEAFCRQLNRSDALNGTKLAHKMLLVADLANIFRILTFQEVREIFKQLSMELEAGELRKYLFVLEKLGLITRFSYSHQQWYVCERSFIDYAYRPPARYTERLRWREKHRRSYAERGDDKRVNAYIAYTKAQGGLKRGDRNPA
jgi:hypothetical protein